MKHRLYSFGFIVFLFHSNLLSAPTDSSLNFAVLGDVHVGLLGTDSEVKMTGSSEAIFEAAARQINQMKELNFVLFDGDLVVDGESFNLARFKEIADELKPPYFVTIGNHDQPKLPKPKEWDYKTRSYYPGELKTTVAALFQGHGFLPDGKTYWSVDTRGFHLVGLDAALVSTWGGHISSEQLNWLEKDLQRNRMKPTVIFLHHNLVESYPQYHLRDKFLVDNRTEVKKILVKYSQVKLVISAHYHFSDANVEDGIPYFTTPSINTYPCRFAVFQLSPKNVEMKTIPVDFSTDPERLKDLREKAKAELIKAKDWMEIVKSPEVMYQIFEAKSTAAYSLR